MRYTKIFMQVALLCGINWLGNQIAVLIPLAIPGNIFGLLTLLGLLEFNILPVTWIEAGSNLLISEMLLFFIPSAIGVVQFQGILRKQLTDLITIILLSTVAVLLVVGVIAEIVRFYRHKRRHYVHTM